MWQYTLLLGFFSEIYNYNKIMNNRIKFGMKLHFKLDSLALSATVTTIFQDTLKSLSKLSSQSPPHLQKDTCLQKSIWLLPHIHL